MQKISEVNIKLRKTQVWRQNFGVSLRFFFFFLRRGEWSSGKKKFYLILIGAKINYYTNRDVK